MTVRRFSPWPSRRAALTPLQHARSSDHGRHLVRSTLVAGALGLGNNLASADQFTIQPWFGGEAQPLSVFLQQHSEEGYSNPLFKPFGISAVGETAHVVDVGLLNHSLLQGSGGRLDIGAGITNLADGTLAFSGLRHIVPVAGLSEAPSITNEGSFTVSGPINLEFNGVRLVNQNGGTINVNAGAHLISRATDLQDGSRVEGTGIAEIAGFVGGAVFSGGSLAIVGSTTGSNAMLSGDWYLPFSLGSARLLGTWVNEGTLHGGFSTQPATPDFGAIGPGAHFTNNGTMVGRALRLIGTDGLQPVDERTHVINNGVMDLRGVPNTVDSAFGSITGTDAVIFENRGTLLIDSGVTDFALDNSGRIEVGSGNLQIFGSNITGRPRSAPTFRSGTQLVATAPSGRIVLDDGGATRPGDFDFFGAIHAERVTLRSHGRYQGNLAVLTGNVNWTFGTFAGLWTNLGTITYTLNDSFAADHFIEGSFVNFGTVEWRRQLNLRAGAAVVNNGVFTMLSNGDTRSVLRGEAGGATESFSNLGRFTTTAPSAAIDGLAFANLGTIEIGADSALTVDNGAFDNGGIITNRGRLEVGANLAGGFHNSGRVEWTKEVSLASGATVVNDGVYDMQPGAGSAVLTGSEGAGQEFFVNNGRFMTTTAGRSFIQLIKFTNNGSLEIRDGGTLLIGTGSQLENFGTIMGNGRLENFGPAIINHGTIAPGLSPGTLTIRGGFENASDGVLELEIASDTVFDVLRFDPGTTVRLGGTLRIKLLNGYVPTIGQSFALLAYDAFAGAFEHVELVGHSGATFSLDYGAKGFRLGLLSLPTAVPVPGAALLLFSALPWLAARRRRVSRA